jgi:hypothetical protein
MKRQMQQKQIRDRINRAVLDAGGFMSLKAKADLRKRLRKEIVIDLVESGVDTAYTIPQFVKFDEMG